MVDLKAHAIHGKLEGDWICAQGSPGPGFHVSRAPVMLPWERERRPVRLSNWAFPMRRLLAARQPLPGPAQKLPLSQSRHPLSRVPTHSLHVSRVSLRLKSKAKLLSSIASWRELQKHLSLSQEVVSAAARGVWLERREPSRGLRGLGGRRDMPGIRCRCVVFTGLILRFLLFVENDIAFFFFSFFI